MIKIEEMNRNDFWQCSSCLMSTEKINMYEIHVGKNLNNQFSATRLCWRCLKDLENKIANIKSDT